VVVGSPIAGRTHRQTENIVGLFANTAIIRTDVSPKLTFLQLLARVKQTVLEAQTHQELPLEKLIVELQPDRNLSRQPLFQVALTMQDPLLDELRFGALRCTLIASPRVTSKLDLRLLVRREKDCLACVFEYATDLFGESMMGQWAEHFEMLLRGLVREPQAAIRDLPFLSDCQQRLIAGDGLRAHGPVDGRLQDIVALQTDRHPDSVAVVCGDRRLTYRQIYERSNQLAHHLKRMGVGPEVTVALHMQRSFDAVIGMLAILKAGGVYMPVPAECPQERLAYMLDDARASVLVTHDAVASNSLPQQLWTVDLDAEAAQIAKHTIQSPLCEAGGANAAALIYTSGSTGRPKGAVLTHSGLMSLVCAQVEELDVRHGDRILQFTNLGFDVSLLEMMLAMSSGASLCLIPSESFDRIGGELPSLMKAYDISVAILPASVLHLLGRQEYPSLKTIVTGGEQCSPDIARYWASKCRFINEYGVTEASVCSSLANVDVLGADAPVPVGRPIAGTRICLLDERQDPVPMGAIGEVFIGGRGVARGYAHRPRFTAERFVPDPLDVGGRLYRTGDWARYLADGTIEVIGRIDQQVKIRGQRIELGEIGHCLRQHPSVANVVVIAREGDPGGARLVAYVVGAATIEPEVDELLRYLRPKLPEYMIPAAIVFLDEIPLTENGKIDRDALPAPDRGSNSSLNGSFLPGSFIEEGIAGIWRDVLKLDKFGIYDDFFDLGGHSLLATQVVSRIAQVFGVELSLRALFDAPTVSQMAACVEREFDRMPAAGKTTLITRSAEGPVRASFAQERLWFLDQLGLVGSA
ncbi:non-ribosomal peptide synthetase, partial [Xanthomonas arboricola]|uniref:non-ribosomal peptide synthetase n=1 Tax=Xanthomonas arboricola TaxID=56448 RepID=UPI000D4215E5